MILPGWYAARDLRGVCGRLVRLSPDVVRCTRVPGAGNQLFESYDADRIQPEQDKRLILVATRSEERVGLAE